MMQSVVLHFEELLGMSREQKLGVPQQCALQLQFNLNFLSSVLVIREVFSFFFLCVCVCTVQ